MKEDPNLYDDRYFNSFHVLLQTLSWPEQWLGLYSPYLWVWKEDRSVRSRMPAVKAVSVLALSCSQKWSVLH